jgi:secreted trypsin-like serine protease
MNGFRRYCSLLFLLLTALAATAEERALLPHRIINGTPVSTENSAFVKVEVGSGLCSGTVIGRRGILTAAHCFSDRPSAADVDVVIDDRRYRAKSYRIHPNFRSNQLYDLATIRLQKQIPSSITPISVLSTVPRKGMSLEMYGYGKDESGDHGVLKVGFMTVRSVRSRYFRAIQSDTGYNSCNGDSGGPALLKVNGISQGILGVIVRGDRYCRIDGEFSRVDYSSARELIRWAQR